MKQSLVVTGSLDAFFINLFLCQYIQLFPLQLPLFSHLVLLHNTLDQLLFLHRGHDTASSRLLIIIHRFAYLGRSDVPVFNNRLQTLVV